MAARKKSPAVAKEQEGPCEKCGGWGLVLKPDGTMDRCDCGIYEALALEQALVQARVPKRFRKKSLETFRVERGDRERAAIRDGAKGFASTFSPEEERGLLLRGGTGAGKTHIAIAILTMVLEAGHRGAYFNVPDLLARMRDSYHADSRERESEILSEMETADLLVLDDLGAEAITDWTRDRLYLIVNRRYDSSRPLVVTTNCDDAELAERIGERIVSRLREMCEVMIFPAEDYRMTRLR